jgi:O-antigen/teichoic acid export membrane protein
MKSRLEQASVPDQMGVEPTIPSVRAFGLSETLSKLLPCVKKGGTAFVDQGLISGSNFLISILLARWLMPEQYGAYAVGFGIFVLSAIIYQSLVLEPMTVFGSSSYRSCLRKYLRSLLSIHFPFCLPISAVLILWAALAGRSGHSVSLASALVGVAIAAPCVLVFWFARACFYVKLSPGPAATGAMFYSALVLSALYVVYRRGFLSPLVAFLLMAGAATATAILLLLWLRLTLETGDPAPRAPDTWRRHWNYGRWALASCFAGWIPVYIYYPLLGSFAGMAQSGELRALMNLTLPLQQVQAAMSLLLLPYAAGIRAERGSQAAQSLSTKITFFTVTAAVLYWSILILVEKRVFHLLYSDRYLEVAHLLPLVALGSIFCGAAFGPGIILRALEAPALLFAAFGSATAISLLIGIPATRWFGISGAIWGGNVAGAASFLMVLLALRYKLRDQTRPIATPTLISPVTAGQFSSPGD